MRVRVTEIQDSLTTDLAKSQHSLFTYQESGKAQARKEAGLPLLASSMAGHTGMA